MDSYFFVVVDEKDLCTKTENKLTALLIYGTTKPENNVHSPFDKNKLLSLSLFLYVCFFLLVSYTMYCSFVWKLLCQKKEQKLKLTQINFNIKLNKRFINNKRSLPFSLSCRFLSSIGYDSTYAWSCVLIFLFLCVYKMIFVMCRRDLLSIFPLFISSVCFTRYVCV